MRPLTGRFHDIVYGQDHAWREHYTGRFQARRAVVLHAVNQGWTLADCQRELLRPGNPGSYLWTHGSDDRLLLPAERTKRVRQDYESAQAKADASPAIRYSDEARQIIGYVIAAVQAIAWRGKAGRTDRDVLLHVCREATRIGSTAVCIAARDAALGAGVTKATAARSLQRLCRAGWLTRTPGKREYHLAQEYRVQEVRHSETYHPSVSEGTVCPVETHPDHECWLQLGKPAMQLWQVLDTSPRSGRELARLAEVSEPTARRNLPRLARYGLAKQSADGWSVGPISPDKVIDHQGWLKDNSLAEYRRQDIADDRAFFRAWSGLDSERDAA